MSGQNRPENATWGSSSSIPLQSTTAVGFSVPDSSEWWTTSRNHGHDFGKSCLSSSRPGIIGKELALQRSLIQVRGQRPSQAGIAGPAQIVSNSGVGNQTTPGDLPVLQS